MTWKDPEQGRYNAVNKLHPKHKKDSIKHLNEEITGIRRETTKLQHNSTHVIPNSWGCGQERTGDKPNI